MVKRDNSEKMPYTQNIHCSREEFVHKIADAIREKVAILFMHTFVATVFPVLSNGSEAWNRRLEE